MRILLVFAAGLTFTLLQTAEEDSHSVDNVAATKKEVMAEQKAVFEELMAGLPKDGSRAASARLELDYWYDNGWSRNTHQRTAVATIEGNAAEVVFLRVPAKEMPGTDFSMAFLLMDKRVVDWTSCWTHNRTAKQKLLLEDVDGDGVSDVAFRASAGWLGLKDERQHGRPASDTKWLYAYHVTSKGFQSIFPNKERELKMEVSYDTADQPIELQCKGIPESLLERQLVECTLSVTNQSDEDLEIKPGEWFKLEMNGAWVSMTYSKSNGPAVLKSGETVSQAIRLHVESKASDVKLCWKFVRNQNRKAPSDE